VIYGVGVKSIFVSFIYTYDEVYSMFLHVIRIEVSSNLTLHGNDISINLTLHGNDISINGSK